ncbi:MAG: hypothetical protein FJW85_09465 [Actinobacteria bacterium]|nr:hypothetical protein [Actinomycetota bacterium]
MRRALAALSAVIVLGAVASLPVAASADTAPRAAQGDCLTVTDITSVTSAAESVACSQSHNAEIFRIGTAPDSTGLPSQAFVTAQQLNTMCAASEATTALAEALDHLGIPAATIPTRVYLSVLLPTDEQWNAGTRTVQCIVGVTSDDADLLPVAQSWTGSAAQKTASEGAGWLLACLPTEPSTGTTLPTRACTSPSWAMVDAGRDVEGTAGTPYPGSALQAAADAVCRPIAEEWTAPDNRADLQFAAVLPPQEAWDVGVHVTSCWIPLAAWSGAVTLTPPTPIPADAQVTVSGATTAFASSTTAYVVRAASADDTGLPRVDMVVTITGTGEFIGGGKERVLATDDLGNLTVTVVAGKSGTFTVTAAIAEKPGVTGSLTVTITAPPKPSVSLTITGKKGTVDKKKGVIISGTSTGLAAGASVTPYFKVQGAKKFTRATAVKVSAKGTFTWRKATGKRLTVYVQSGATKSNQVSVRP